MAIKISDLSGDWRSAYRSRHYELGAAPLERGFLPKAYRVSDELDAARRNIRRETARIKALHESALLERLGILKAFENLELNALRRAARSTPRHEPRGPARAPGDLRRYVFLPYAEPPAFRSTDDVECIEATDEIMLGVIDPICVVSAKTRETAIERFHALHQVRAFGGPAVNKYHVLEPK